MRIRTSSSGLHRRATNYTNSSDLSTFQPRARGRRYPRFQEVVGEVTSIQQPANFYIGAIFEQATECATSTPHRPCGRSLESNQVLQINSLVK